ncbi:Upstream activation factor subunit spp27 [Zalerion maritima]|uniref:Upstream activation factor subunit spp27 n=1 Tax=Zalerion maritima TaxID=339359 RepID=A0AAD5RVI1_9PEZI|nr:Upstream activation factor subunit spp27 [Zalerion maritima]
MGRLLLDASLIYFLSQGHCKPPPALFCVRQSPTSPTPHRPPLTSASPRQPTLPPHATICPRVCLATGSSNLRTLPAHFGCISSSIADSLCFPAWRATGSADFGDIFFDSLYLLTHAAWLETIQRTRQTNISTSSAIGPASFDGLVGYRRRGPSPSLKNALEAFFIPSHRFIDTSNSSLYRKVNLALVASGFALITWNCGPLLPRVDHSSLALNINSFSLFLQAPAHKPVFGSASLVAATPFRNLKRTPTTSPQPWRITGPQNHPTHCQTPNQGGSHAQLLQHRDHPLRQSISLLETASHNVGPTRIIDEILLASDLSTVTRKKIRSGLEQRVDTDLSAQKNAVKLLIENRFDVASNQAPSSLATPDEPTYSPAKRSHEDYEEEDDAEGEDETPAPVPIRKKQKRESSIEDQDARLAAQLQAEENNLGRVRKTRGGGAAKPAKKVGKKVARKKSKPKVEDSDAEGAAEKPKRNTGFQKPFNLSFPLSELVGGEQMSRPQVVKKIWEHIKANDLQDPSDKRHINCDDKMTAVFKTNRVHMFSMNKMLGAHLYPLDEADFQALQAPDQVQPVKAVKAEVKDEEAE